jgi:hypothetical protein
MLRMHRSQRVAIQVVEWWRLNTKKSRRPPLVARMPSSPEDDAALNRALCRGEAQRLGRQWFAFCAATLAVVTAKWVSK